LAPAPDGIAELDSVFRNLAFHACQHTMNVHNSQHTINVLKEGRQRMMFFIYARKSTEDEARQVLSIQSQLDELREYARKESVQVVREYTEAMTAKEPGRPVFNEMMEAVERGEANGLLAWHPDRLSRNSVYVQ